MMESALFPENDEKPTPSNAKSTLLSHLVESGGSNTLFEEDADLFGSLDEPAATTNGGVMGGAANSNGAPTGGSSSVNANSFMTANGDPLSAEKPVEQNPVSSKLAFSGLLGEESGGGSSSGLFDEIDNEPVQPEPAAQPELLNQVNQSSEHVDGDGLMQEMNLNELDSFGMGMGMGGAIPREEVSPQQQQQPPQGVMNTMAGSVYYSTSGAGQMHMNMPPRQPPKPQQPSVLAGMHVGHDVNLGGVPQQPNNSYPQQQAPPKSLTDYTPPPAFNSPYGKITITDPMLIQGTGLFAGPPHWTYLVTLYSKSNTPQPVSAVRRRFRHFVALETRLRQSVPGAILPPRPEKHPARAIEEASARQSAEFAMGRANELSVYMNALANHPHVGTSPELKLFLTLQDHIGTAWPEVSGSALTRITTIGTATVDKLADTMDAMLSELGTAQQVAAGEDNAEILALAAYEGRRIGSVTSSVPKIEGTVGIVKDRGDRMGATGLEMSKLSKDVAWCDRELASPMEVLSSALLRSGRRMKRLGLEVQAGVAPFVTQYKLCRYEQMAFVDRRTALKRRSEARGSADKRAAKVMMNQTSMASMGRLGTLEKMEMEAAMFDEMATEAAKEADEVAVRLQNEVGRIGSIRVREWDGGMKVVACAMKEACSENVGIWEAALECFKREFPDVPVPSDEVLESGEGENN